jgi:hypothetical protein
VGDLAVGFAGVPVCSHVLGICDRGCGAVRGDAGRVDGFVAADALSSICAGGIRSGDEETEL